MTYFCSKIRLRSLVILFYATSNDRTRISAIVLDLVALKRKIGIESKCFTIRFDGIIYPRAPSHIVEFHLHYYIFHGPIAQR